MKNIFLTLVSLFLLNCATNGKAPAVRQVSFGFDRDTVSNSAKSDLEKVVKEARAKKNVVLLVAGHTDALGSDLYNLDLGDRRAQAVKAHLVANGVSEKHLVTVTYGESKQIGHKRASAENRRVVVSRVEME